MNKLVLEDVSGFSSYTDWWDYTVEPVEFILNGVQVDNETLSTGEYELGYLLSEVMKIVGLEVGEKDEMGMIEALEEWGLEILFKRHKELLKVVGKGSVLGEKCGLAKEEYSDYYNFTFMEDVEESLDGLFVGIGFFGLLYILNTARMVEDRESATISAQARLNCNLLLRYGDTLSFYKILEEKYKEEIDAK